MDKNYMLYNSAADYNLMMRITAEMLAMPERVCRRPLCHRQRCCRYVDRQSFEPYCLSRLTPEMRSSFDALFTVVIRVADYITDPVPSRNADERALQEAAIEIIRACRRSQPRLAKRFEEWRAKYAGAEPAPQRQLAVPSPQPVVSPETDTSLRDTRDDWRAYV